MNRMRGSKFQKLISADDLVKPPRPRRAAKPMTWEEFQNEWDQRKDLGRLRGGGDG